jgi:hypothetical protein
MKPVRILGRDYSMAILRATGQPESATSLSDSLDIPIATCYRRLDELVSVGLLEEHTTDRDLESDATRYQRTTDVLGIRFAPTPSLFAWTCARQAVGADASTLEAPGRSQTIDSPRSAPVEMPGLDTSAGPGTGETAQKDAKSSD